MIEPVEQLTAYKLVVDRLRRVIHLGTFGPGDRLPSERDLAEQLGVSRMTVREAIRVLQTQGYVETRRGAAGGLVVIANQQEGESLRRHLREEWKHFEDVLDFRVANERAVARLAATRREEEDLRKLEEAVEHMRSSQSLWQFRRADSTFHLAVAEAAKNTLLIKAVEDGRAAMFLPLEPLEYEISVVELLEVHPQILEAIAERDVDKAGDIMTDHLKSTRRRLAAVLRLDGNP